MRDGAVPGGQIRVLEHHPFLGGSLDGSGEDDTGYLVRGGRMFEPHFVCTTDLLSGIPSADDPARSVWEDILRFNEAVPGFSQCRLARDGGCAPDRYELQLSKGDIVDLNRLLLTGESRLGGRRIDEWFGPSFFESNFWVMWATMFSFQPWHSLMEMRRYLRRFIHLFPGFTRIAGILRTRYNQYDAMIVPLRNWLTGQGVRFRTGATVEDIEIEGDLSSRRVSKLVLRDGNEISVRPSDRVYLTLGSMTDGSRAGSIDAAPSMEDSTGPAWQLWRRLAQRYEGFGNPEAFCGDTERTAWNSFTVTLDGHQFPAFLEAFTGNRSGTGGLVTFDRSGWLMSIVMFHQPHFREQDKGSCVFWGYGLRGDRIGDFVRKPMWQATGREILAELAGHLRLDDNQLRWFDSARIIPCRMPFITSQFMPRTAGDRPPLRPSGAENFALTGQFCEMPRDCVFTVEYSVRSAWSAVHEMTGEVPSPPPVSRSDLNPRILLRAARVLMGA